MLALVSPAMASRWMFGREMYRGFVAGSLRDADSKFIPRSTSADADVKKAYKIVAARCRDQVANNSLISGGINRICNNVVRGGILPQFKFRTRDGKLDRDTNSKWRVLFTRWTKYCDITGHDSYGSLQRLGLRHMWSDGQYLIHRVYDTSLPGIVPLRLELIECDQLDALVDGILPGGNVARKGIEYDAATGRPVAYHILPEHPGDYLALGRRTKSTRIPATEIIHVWRRDRISQYSGIAWLVAVVMESYRMEDFRHITQDAARIQATFAAFLKSAYPGFTLGGGLSFGGQAEPISPASTGENVEAPEEIRHNVIQPLPTGTDITFAAPSHPGDNYEPFVKDSQRWQSGGLGMSFEAYANNYTDASYASSRSGALEERLSYQAQQQFLEEQMNRKVLAWFIEAAYIAGLAPGRMAGYARDPQLYHEMAEGQFPGWSWVDPRNDATASEKILDLNLDTHRNLAAQRGLDWYATIEELIEEEQHLLELETVRQARKKIEEENNAE
ncbi:hypothetical protein DGMP_06540 [Desulfomarina profundi]|uniref:Phage portal protein n=1 Tax=Desulfomarina profundi TaxID=2772557 RepID=A0A8D5JQF4_9BACT|nr:hypothetical protein DGMP_06540 [Desulfomarina profundi]